MVVGNKAAPATERLSGKAYTQPSRMRTVLMGNRFRTGLLRLFLIYALLFVAALLFLAPFYWMVNTALKQSNQVFTLPPT